MRSAAVIPVPEPGSRNDGSLQDPDTSDRRFRGDDECNAGMTRVARGWRGRRGADGRCAGCGRCVGIWSPATSI